MSRRLKIFILFFLLSITPFVRGCGESFGFPLPAFVNVLRFGSSSNDYVSTSNTIDAIKEALGSVNTLLFLAVNFVIAWLLANSVLRNKRQPIWTSSFLGSLAMGLSAIWLMVGLMCIETKNTFLKKIAELYGALFGRVFIEIPSSISDALDKALLKLHYAPVLIWNKALKSLAITTEDIVARSWFITIVAVLAAALYILKKPFARSKKRHRKNPVVLMRRKTVKRIIYLLVLFPAVIFVLSWAYMNNFIKIDTKEVDRYYDILSRHGKAPGGIVFKLDISEEDSLQTVVDKIKSAMGLKNYSLWVGYGDTGGRPAFITAVAPGIMTITLSRKVEQRREQINVLIHELIHIYVWAIDKSLLKDCDEERFTDCAGVFLGLGIPILNGLTDETFFMPGGEYYSEKRMYGYVRPEQLGYLLARYCDERGIPYSKIKPYLSSTGRKYFNVGHNYLKRSRAAGKKQYEEMAPRADQGVNAQIGK